MSETVDLEKANKITIELLVHGYLRLHILAHCSSSDIPLKVFNALLSTIICTDIETCCVLSICLKILKGYDKWVNIEKQEKKSFLCDIPISHNDVNKYSSPSQLMEIYFDHISNLHGLTYKDYDILRRYCIEKMYNHHSFNLHGSNISMLNECVAIDCLILSDEQRKKLQTLIRSSSGSSSSEYNDLSLENATNTLQREDSYDSEEMMEHKEEAEDKFPNTMIGGIGRMGTRMNNNTFIGGANAMINSNVTSLLAPNWRSNKGNNLSIRSKWQRHVATVSSTDVSGMISQLSLLDIASDDILDIDDNTDDNTIKNGLDIVLPSPTTPNIASISVKSYKFLFDNINTKTMDGTTNNDNNNNDDNSIGVRELNQMEINPFDLLPDQPINDKYDDDDDDNKDNKDNNDGKRKSNKIRKSKKIKNFEYEFGSKLSDILHEMDLMDEGKLDLADFSTALMSVIKNNHDYDFMSISMKIFDDDNGIKKDDMDSAKIDDIITWIINNNDDDIINLKKLICNGLKIEYNDNNTINIEDDDDNDDDDDEEEEHDEFEGLELKEKEKSDEPYKPIYQITSGIQRFGNKKNTETKTKKKAKKKENNNNNNNDDDDDNKINDNLPSLTITKSISDEGISDILDKIHVYLFHAVHDVKQIPL